MTSRLLAAALLVATSAVPALAGTGWSSFDLAYSDEDPSVAAQIDKDVGARVERIWAQLSAPERWDDSAAGPFALVKQDARIEYEQPGTGRLRVEVSVTPRVALPSESVSARALAERMLDLLRDDIETAVAMRRQQAVAVRRGELRAAEAATKAAAQAVQHHVAEWGDLDTSREIATARLREAAADLADTRIERAVTSHRLEAARKAVERAAEAADLREQADAVELETRNTESDPTQRVRQLARLAHLRALVRDAESSAPPLDVARQRVFDMEVDLVGLEARQALLEPEVAELRTQCDALSVARRTEAELRRSADAARADEAQLVTEVRVLERAARGPSVVVTQFRSSSR